MLKTTTAQADRGDVKGLEKLTSMRLAEVLTQKGIVPVDAITDALYVQDKRGESFVDVLVESGHIAEWDLAKVVVEVFQLPFLLAGGYQISDEAKSRVPPEKLFEHLLVPLDVFDNLLTVSMPVLTPADALVDIETSYQVKIFPYVGLISENKKVLMDEFQGFKEWLAADQQAKEKRLKLRGQESASSSRQPEQEGGWTNLFDTADQAVKDSISKGRN